MGIMYRCSLGGGGETCEFIAPDYDANKTDYAADDVVLKDGKVMKYNGSEWEDFSLAECTTLNSNLGGLDFSKFTLKKTITSAAMGELVGVTTNVQYTPSKKCNALLFVLNGRYQYGHNANITNLGTEIFGFDGLYGRMYSLYGMNDVTSINGSFYSKNDGNGSYYAYCYIYTDE